MIIKENRAIKYGIWIFTIVVYALVFSMHYLPSIENVPAFTKSLPLLHAILNGSCFIFLIASLIAIKNKNVALHQRLNTLAMIFSVIFLLSYVLYHITNDDTIYEGEYKAIYYFILLTHIILAGASLPAILFAYYSALIGDIQKHRKIVRYTYPVWLYVAFTGVLVYLFLSPYY